MGGLYILIPPATTEADYTITLGPPFRTDDLKHVVAFETLPPAQQEVFVAVYRSNSDGNRHINQMVSWDDRQSSPYYYFLTIDYVQYRDRYYPVTATVEKDHTSYTVIRYGLLGLCGMLTVLLLATVWLAKSVPIAPR